MHWGWYAATISISAVDWLMVGLDKSKWRMVTKPGVMLVLLAGFTLAGGWQGEGTWFGLGLLFSLAGDFLLMLPSNGFIAGLVAFLVAHIAYIIGFNQSFVIPGWGFLLAVLALAVFDGLSYWNIRKSIMSCPKDRWLRYPLLVYMVVISLMVFSGLLCWFRPDWPLPAAVMVSLGALLFYFSDTTLAFDRFCKPVRGGQILVITTYHIAQISIVAGVLFRAARM